MAQAHGRDLNVLTIRTLDDLRALYEELAEDGAPRPADVLVVPRRIAQPILDATTVYNPRSRRKIPHGTPGLTFSPVRDQYVITPGVFAGDGLPAPSFGPTCYLRRFDDTPGFYWLCDVRLDDDGSFQLPPVDPCRIGLVLSGRGGGGGFVASGAVAGCQSQHCRKCESRNVLARVAGAAFLVCQCVD